jgi:hypothetical protein
MLPKVVGSASDRGYKLGDEVGWDEVR